jgi:pyrroloquinoline quinone biosynthesis protein B
VIIRILGSAAGGGFPQWNCGCPNCRGVRDGTVRALARTQECVAISADGREWFLLNCSPEIRGQIESFEPLHPRSARHSPIAGILLTNGDLDHTLGLLSLREGQPLTVYATGVVRRGFSENNVLARTLERFPGQLTWRELDPDREVELVGASGPTGLRVRAVTAPGKVALHLEATAAPGPLHNVGLLVRDGSGRGLAYFSAVAEVTPAVAQALAAADCIFFDGTFWQEDELPRLGLGQRLASQMAHLPVGGPGGSLAALAGLPARRRIYIHVNNTNPILREDSAERAAIVAAGWEVAYDGQEVRL